MLLKISEMIWLRNLILVRIIGINITLRILKYYIISFAQVETMNLADGVLVCLDCGNDYLYDDCFFQTQWC